MRRLVAPLTVAVLALATPAAKAQDVAVPDGPDITVNALSVDDLRKKLTDCIARQCPVGEEIDATLALADNLFIAGQYAEAKKIMRTSLHRNRRHRKTDPGPVAELARAASRVASHMGDSDADLFHAREARATLKGALGGSEERAFGSLLEVGDAMVRAARIEDAGRLYMMARRRAIEEKDPVLEATARIRLASMYAGLATPQNRYGGLVKVQLRHLLRQDDPRMADFRVAAELLIARLNAKLGDASQLEQLIEKHRIANKNAPLTMVYAADLDVPLRPSDAGEWADLGFWVDMNGKVGAVDVLKQSDRKGRWAAQLTENIARRRYQAFTADATARYVVERFSVVKRRIDKTSSKIAQYNVSVVSLVLDEQQDTP
ncbi:hypothetical protein NYR55_11980 [Sphingomonas sp. BGYR3]|uniref:hypothetical protein n=1 Tax=Sphingomonas sp. BGYR3 TaxID=2975483 RepID=UPI0021A31112|nr:hypothetical protein [Sphingomonas sp. BGYR3]MDG5489334.1 hypothetical protein [Sphingomonas sp. BGYR3]